MTPRLVFLKLGGSLITDKNVPRTLRMEVLQRLAQEIAAARQQDGELQILLGHGSGSFGHPPASKYHTRKGVHTQAEWLGFVQVWREAIALNQLVMQALAQADLPALSLPPLAMVIAKRGRVASWNLEPLQHALAQGLLPVIFGDVIFDQVLGGTILSTEDLFSHLAVELKPSLLLLAGDQPGVWAVFPAMTRLLDEITPANLPQVEAGLQASAAVDVTGGMLEKVRLVTRLVQTVPGLQGRIFSGEVPGNVLQALLGGTPGTEIHA